MLRRHKPHRVCGEPQLVVQRKHVGGAQGAQGIELGAVDLGPSQPRRRGTALAGGPPRPHPRRRGDGQHHRCGGAVAGERRDPGYLPAAIPSPRPASRIRFTTPSARPRRRRPPAPLPRSGSWRASTFGGRLFSATGSPRQSALRSLELDTAAGSSSCDDLGLYLCRDRLLLGNVAPRRETGSERLELKDRRRLFLDDLSLLGDRLFRDPRPRSRSRPGSSAASGKRCAGRGNLSSAKTSQAAERGGLALPARHRLHRHALLNRLKEGETASTSRIPDAWHPVSPARATRRGFPTWCCATVRNEQPPGGVSTNVTNLRHRPAPHHPP